MFGKMRREQTASYPVSSDTKIRIFPNKSYNAGKIKVRETSAAGAGLA